MSDMPLSGWWAGKGDAARLWEVIRQLKRDHGAQIRHDKINRRVYSSRAGREIAQRADVSSVIRAMGFIPADLNFTRPIVDALWSRIGNNQPAIKMAGDGARWNQRRKARQLDAVIEGTVENLGVAAKASAGLRASLIVRGGILEVGAGSKGKIFADKFPCEELLFDEDEAKYGEPRQAHRIMRISKEVLIAKFPGHRAAIENAKLPETGPFDAPRSAAARRAMAEVAKSWHLPSEPGGDDGAAIMSIDGAILDTKPWKRDTFPFAVIRGSEPMEGEGYWPSSLVDDLANLQYQVNTLFRKLQENAYHTATLKVFIRSESQVPKKHLAGQRPHYVVSPNGIDDVRWHVPDPFPPSQLQFLEFLIRQMHEVSGVSQLMVQSKNPLGAGASGAALAEFYDIESERFSQLELAYARFWRDIGRLIIEAAQDMADDEDFRRQRIRWVKQSVIHHIEWKDVDLEADQFELHLEPTGFLPNTRAGKMQVIEQLLANGMLDQKWAIYLAGFPDLKQANMVLSAPLEWVLWAMDQIEDVVLKEGKDVEGEEIDEEESAEVPAPDAHTDLDLAIAVGKAMLQLREAESTKDKPYPEVILERFRTFLDWCDAQKRKGATAAPMAAAAPPMGADPMAMAAPMGAPPPMPAGDPPGLPPPAPGVM